MRTLTLAHLMAPRYNYTIMEYTHSHESHSKPVYSLKDFLPLIGTFVVVAVSTVFFGYVYNAGELTDWMRFFEGSFFLIFGVLKVINIRGFVDAYSMYDLVARRIKAYGYIYPFIELGLGLAYILGFALVVTNWITLVVTLTGALGVFIKLREKEVVPCACLGAIFKIPMTWVTLFEDLLMAGMAALMLFVL